MGRALPQPSDVEANHERPMNWSVAVTISVVLYSIAVILQRSLLRGGKINAVGFSVVFQLLVAIVLLPIAAIHGLRFEGFEKEILLIMLASASFGIGSVVYAKTLERIGSAEFSVLFATSSIWVALYGVLFLHETLSVVQIIGMLMIFASVFLLVKKTRKPRLSTGILLGLFTGVIYGIAVTSTSLIGRHVDVITWTWLSFITGALASLLVSPRSIVALGPLVTRRTMPRLIILAVFYGIGTLTIMMAYRDGPFSLVSPLRQTSIIVTTILAFILVRSERVDMRRKCLAASVCTVGVILMLL